MKVRKHTNKPVMRAATKFQPWDFGYMLDLESKSLKEMTKYFESSEIAVGNQRRAQHCRIMAKLLAIAQDEDVDYLEVPECEFVPDGIGQRLEFKGEAKMKKHVNINNAHRFMLDYRDSPISRSVLRQEKAWYLYNQMRNQHLRSCWD